MNQYFAKSIIVSSLTVLWKILNENYIFDNADYRFNLSVEASSAWMDNIPSELIELHHVVERY